MAATNLIERVLFNPDGAPMIHQIARLEVVRNTACAGWKGGMLLTASAPAWPAWAANSKAAEAWIAPI